MGSPTSGPSSCSSQWPPASLSPTLIGSISIMMRVPGLPLRHPGRCARPGETQEIGDVWPQASRSWLDPGGAGPSGVSGPRKSCPDSDLSQGGRAGSRASQGPDQSRRQWRGGCRPSLGSRGRRQWEALASFQCPSIPAA